MKYVNTKVHFMKYVNTRVHFMKYVNTKVHFMKKYNIWTNFFGDVGNCNFFMNCIETYQFSLV